MRGCARTEDEPVSSEQNNVLELAEAERYQIRTGALRCHRIVDQENSAAFKSYSDDRRDILRLAVAMVTCVRQAQWAPRHVAPGRRNITVEDRHCMGSPAEDV